MKTKIIQFIPAILSLTAIGFSNFSQWCSAYGHLCYRTVLDRMIPDIIYPLYFFVLYFLPIAIILAFVPKNIFNSWLKFTSWAIPFAIIFIAMTPVIDTSLLPFSRSDAARLAGGLFTVVSLFLIIWKWWRSRRNSGQV